MLIPIAFPFWFSLIAAIIFFVLRMFTNGMGYKKTAEIFTIISSFFAICVLFILALMLWLPTLSKYLPIQVHH